jgi:hypothetical protein
MAETCQPTVLIRKFTIDHLGKYEATGRSVVAVDAALADRRAWARVAPPKVD